MRLNSSIITFWHWKNLLSSYRTKWNINKRWQVDLHFIIRFFTCWQDFFLYLLHIRSNRPASWTATVIIAFHKTPFCSKIWSNKRTQLSCTIVLVPSLWHKKKNLLFFQMSFLLWQKRIGSYRIKILKR
jgi:hypothetical protein